MVAGYYNLLGLNKGCSVNDLKRAYRAKARQYHPDLNQWPGAADMFIKVTEAYEYLLNKKTENLNHGNNESDYYRRWEENLRQQTRERARAYAHMGYDNFTKSKTYHTTRIFDGTTIIYGLAISVLIIGVDIYSYTWLKSNATTKEEEPSVTFMILLLLLGMVFFTFSFINLLSFIQSSRKKRKPDEPQS